MKKFFKRVVVINLILSILITSTSLSVKGATNVSNCGKDENGRMSGGVAGDQTGEEYVVEPWYNYNIGLVLRYKDSNVAMTIAQLAVNAANNDMIGYDQDQRHTYWEQLEKVNYDPSAIKTPCEADCSASTCANVKAAGYILNIPELKAIDDWGYTGSMLKDFAAHGFQVLTGPQYTGSPDNLLPGDILLNEASHTNIYVGDAQGGSISRLPSTEASFPIDDITVNLDEQNFEFAGTPKTVSYSGSKKAGEWIFKGFSQFVDFIVALITNGIKTSILGWAMTFESAVDSSLKFIEGED